MKNIKLFLQFMFFKGTCLKGCKKTKKLKFKVNIVFAK
ncbi:hypothetical protein MODO_3377 [Myroides odoratimimus]|nr:hypothetical protein MODO_3377 [Myroides odoratimimus]